jgi:hypothetical protein
MAAVVIVDVGEAAGILVGAATALPEAIVENRDLSSPSAISATSQTITPLSVGIGLKRIFSPTMARMQDTRRPMVLTPSGTLTLELSTTLQVSLTS